MQLNLDFSEPEPKAPRKQEPLEIDPPKPKLVNVNKTSEFGGAFEDQKSEESEDSESSSSSSESSSEDEEMVEDAPKVEEKAEKIEAKPVENPQPQTVPPKDPEKRNQRGERVVKKVGQRGKLSVTYQTFTKKEEDENTELIIEPVGKRKREEEDASRKRKKIANKTLAEVVAKYESMVEKTRVAVVDTEMSFGDGDSWESFGFAGRLRNQLGK